MLVSGRGGSSQLCRWARAGRQLSHRPVLIYPDPDPGYGPGLRRGSRISRSSGSDGSVAKASTDTRPSVPEYNALDRPSWREP